MVRGRAVSQDVRKIIIHLSQSGKSAAQIGKDVNMSRYTIRNIIRLHKTTGCIAEKPNIGRKSSVSAADIRSLRRLIKLNRRCNFSELRKLWNESTGKSFSRTTCIRTAHKMGFKAYKVC